jgi:hypothetical protein
MTPDRTRWCELLVGLERVEVLNVVRHRDRLVVNVESTDRLMGCGACGTRAKVWRGAPSFVVWPDSTPTGESHTHEAVLQRLGRRHCRIPCRRRPGKLRQGHRALAGVMARVATWPLVTRTRSLATEAS